MLMDAKEFEFLYSTVIVFGLITFGIYLCLLKPFLAPAQPAAADTPAARAAALAAAARRNGGGATVADVRSFALHHTGSGGAGNGGGLVDPSTGSSSKGTVSKNTRWPPHVTTSHAAVVDGLVSFRHTKAATQSEELATRDRARVLSKLLVGTGSGSAPTLPPRGSTWILALPNAPSDESSSPLYYDVNRMRQVLLALGTYYNLLVILALDAGGGDEGKSPDPKAARLEWIARVRGGSSATVADPVAPPLGSVVGEDVLPSHRVLAATTVAGRVALVRQVQRVGMILDFDATVQDQLSRFGHKVVVYDPSRL